MRHVLSKFAPVLLASALHPALAETPQRACLLEGSFTLMGQKTEIKDCLENNGVPREQFVDSCKEISNATTIMGAPPAKITYLATCPAKAQGSCEGFFGSSLNAYYYKRDPQTLADTKKSCTTQGGKWKGG